MDSIDLLPFAEHSQKLPRKFLAPSVKEEETSETGKLLAGHLIDFWAVALGTTFLAVSFNHYVSLILITKTLRQFHQHQSIYTLSFCFLPVVLFSYFFLSYFMNHGQSYGLFLMKRRISMKPSHLRDSLYWAFRSFSLCLSCGLSYLFNKESWRSLRQEDYLYEELLSHKEQSPVNLFDLIEKREMEAQSSRIEIKEAA